MRHTGILMFLCGLLALRAGAQALQDSAYVRSYPHTVTVRLYSGEKISTFNLQDRARDRQINYYPNNALTIGLGATIRGLGLNFSTRIPFRDTKDDLYGRTRRYDLQVHRYRPMLALDIYLQRYTGFHLNTLDDVSQVSGSTRYTYFPNLRTYTFGASGMYIFNGKKFSLKAPVTQGEWQLRSAGSFLLGASFFTHFLRNDTTLIPEYYRHPEIYNGFQVQQIDNYGLTVNGGYAYTLVINRHWFLYGSAEAGAGPAYSLARDVNGEQLSRVGLNVKTNLRFSLGYNADRWFGGLYAIYHTDRYPLPFADSRMSTSQGVFRVVVARRLSTRKKILGG